MYFNHKCVKHCKLFSYYENIKHRLFHSRLRFQSSIPALRSFSKPLVSLVLRGVVFKMHETRFHRKCLGISSSSKHGKYYTTRNTIWLVEHIHFRTIPRQMKQVGKCYSTHKHDTVTESKRNSIQSVTQPTCSDFYNKRRIDKDLV
jgi:hypothetical protein